MMVLTTLFGFELNENKETNSVLLNIIFELFIVCLDLDLSLNILV